jgi:hypothetical protein
VVLFKTTTAPSRDPKSHAPSLFPSIASPSAPMVKQTVKRPAHRWYRRWRRSERLGWRKWIVDCPDARHSVGSPSFNKTMLAYTLA